MWTLQSVIDLINTKIRNATRKTKISNIELADVLKGQAEFVDERHDNMLNTFNTWSGNYIDRFGSLETTLYINQTTGLDTNTGTQALPLKTLSRAADIASYKFQTLNLVIIGDYNLSSDVVFHVSALTVLIQAGKTFTFKKRLINEGETVFCLRLDGLYLRIEGETDSAKLITETNAGHVTGDPYWLGSTLGAIKVGNTNRYYSYLPSIVNLYNLSVQLGGNTALVCGNNGTSDANVFRYHVRFESNVTNWNIAATSKIAPYCRQSYYRKSILFNDADAWQIVGRQADLLLLSGAYSVRACLSTYTVGGEMYQGMFSGMMSWYAEPTNDGLSGFREIMLHGMGHNLAGKKLRLRTVSIPITTDTTNGKSHRLEALLDEVLSGPITVEFFFSKLD